MISKMKLPVGKMFSSNFTASCLMTFLVLMMVLPFVWDVYWKQKILFVPKKNSSISFFTLVCWFFDDHARKSRSDYWPNIFIMLKMYCSGEREIWQSRITLACKLYSLMCLLINHKSQIESQFNPIRTYKMRHQCDVNCQAPMHDAQ